MYWSMCFNHLFYIYTRFSFTHIFPSIRNLSHSWRWEWMGWFQWRTRRNWMAIWYAIFIDDIHVSRILECVGGRYDLPELNSCRGDFPLRMRRYWCAFLRYHRHVHCFKDFAIAELGFFSVVGARFLYRLEYRIDPGSWR